MKHVDFVLCSPDTVRPVAAIELAGATPLLVDIEPNSFTLDVNKLADTLRQNRSHKIKVVIPVHLYGHCLNLDALEAIKSRHKISLIEDCAQSIGAAWSGRGCGSVGHWAATSFYPTKNLGCMGDGPGTVGKIAASLPLSIHGLTTLRNS